MCCMCVSRLQHLNLQGNHISEIPFMLPDRDGDRGQFNSKLKTLSSHYILIPIQNNSNFCINPCLNYIL